MPGTSLLAALFVTRWRWSPLAAKDRYPSGPLSFQSADCLHLPAPNHFADLFVSLETIEHLMDDDAFLREVVRVLKPDGIFICSGPKLRALK